MDDKQPQQTKVVKAKTKRGKRILEAKAPKLVEDAKRALILYGNNTSQQIKDVLSDISKLKGLDTHKYTRKNPDVKPFDAGGDVSLEFFAQKSNCSLFALGSHSKKRPNNIILGRMHDFHLYDAMEFGVDGYAPISQFAGAGMSQIGNKPCIIFVGDKFESVPELRQAKSLLLDFFRGLQVDRVNIAGLDRVMVATAVDDKRVLLRQYTIKYKKSGSKVPRVALSEMGPRMDLSLRRVRVAPPDVEKEAMAQPKLKKKVKNVSTDVLDGKVGRIYMPKQKVDAMALAKPKGLKRERRQDAADRKEAKRQKAAGGGAAGGDEE